MAGLTLSIVSNYLNRVVGNRTIGNRIVLQGGVAKNPAMPLAFAQLLGKPVVVPPDPELMGAYGVALMALARLEDGTVKAAPLKLSELSTRSISAEKEYRCRACENLCPIRIMKVGESRHHFGGRCNKFANLRRKVELPAGEVKDWVEVRRQLYFETYAAQADVLPRGGPRGGRPRGALGPLALAALLQLLRRARACASSSRPRCRRRGWPAASRPSAIPAELAHGQMGTLLEQAVQPDFVFLPHLKTMPSYQKDVHACLCPIMQGLPYTLRTAFSLDEARLLRPVLDLDRRLRGRPRGHAWRWPSGWAGPARTGARPGRWRSSGRPPATARGGGWAGRRWTRPSAAAGRPSSSSGARTTPSRPARTWGSRASS